MLKPAVATNFDDYAQDVFIPYLSTKLQTVSRLDLVWDRYTADSLKGSARSKRGKGVRRRMVGVAAIPGNWQNFLRVDTNKTELFKFLDWWKDKNDDDDCQKGMQKIAESENYRGMPPASFPVHGD